MKKIIICNTTYQLLFAINIRLNSLPADQVDILLTDRTDFINSYGQICKYRYFDNAFLIKPDIFKKPDKMPGNLRYKLENIVCFKWILNRRYGLTLDTYDEMYACNMTDDIVIVAYSLLKKKNSQLKCIEFEDNYGTYINPLRNKGKELKAWLYKIFKAPYLCEQEIDYCLLYFPELYVNNDLVKKEKMLTMDLADNEIQKEIKNIFNCHKYYIKHRYILLEESFKADGLHNNVDKLFSEIIDAVGNENVLLKTHPRNKDNYYSARKVAVFAQPVAWEALMAGQNIDDKVLITCTSGTAINAKLLYHSKCKIIFLRNLMTGENSIGYTKNYKRYFEHFIEKFGDECYVPDSLEELREILYKI